MNLNATISLHGGGPGSGCRGPNCGRPSLGNQSDITSLGKKDYISSVAGPYPTAGYEADPKGWDDYFEKSRPAGQRWEQSVAAAITMGKMSPDDARKLGSYGNNSGNDWQPLPETVYHVTTAADAVIKDGLKSRFELEQDTGRGLGGGDDQSISMTDSLKTASAIRDAMIEGKKVASGEWDIPKMLDMAREGTAANRPYLSDLKNYYDKQGGFDAMLRGVQMRSALGHPPDEPGNWRPAKGRDGWMGGDGKMKYGTWERDSTEKEKLDDTFQFFKSWLMFRQEAGGPENPLFFGSDTDYLKKVDPSQIRILQFKSKPGTRGVFMGRAENEYRIFTGKAVEFDKIVK